MKKLLVLSVLLCAGFAMADGANLWKCDFEEGEGFTEGKVAGQNGWDKLAWWANDEVFVVKGDAVSGEQFIESNPSGVNVQNNNIDISDDYQEGSKLMMSAYGQANFVDGGQDMSVRFHCLGTSGKTYDVEIAEFNFKQNGTINAWVTGCSFSTTAAQGEWVKFGVVIDPADKKVEKVFIGDTVREDEGMTYKSATTEGCGNLPDGFRIYNGSGKIDNISIDVVPEPAFLGLLALAGLFFVRKQR